MVDREFSQKNGVAVIETPTSAATFTPDPKWIATEEKSDIEDNSGRLVKVYDDMSILGRLTLFLAELSGTACLVFIGCLGCLTTNLEQIAFTFGLAIMIGVQISGHISGGHINPAVTVAAATLGNFPLVNVPIYICGQLFGAISGFGLVRALISITPHTNDICSPTPNKSLSDFQVFLAEFLLTFILIWVCCAVWDSRNSTKHDSLPLRLGLAVTGLAMAGIPFTGANMNPARSFGPALINGSWERHWAYWIGPILGSFVAALSYRIIFGKEAKNNETFPE